MSAEAMTRAGDHRTQVLLVSMPFGVLYSPSLALGILQAKLQAAGIAAECRHFTIDYAARIGVDAYNRIAGGFPRTTSLVGEWIFSHALHRRSPSQQEAYLREVLGDEDIGDKGNSDAIRLERELRLKSIEAILRLAAEAGEFIDTAAKEILARNPQVVGLTSVFEQNLASIALAQRLRSLAPNLTIVMGGANCESDMGRELARRYPFVDIVISGEADCIIAPLVKGLLRGIAWQDNDELRPHIDTDTSAGSFLQAQLIRKLDDEPRPVFDSYFEDLARCPPVSSKVDVQIPMESSRGCWWGAKHHCTFCGLNGASMAFRSKTPGAVLADVCAYREKYPGCKFSFVDNIMDRDYYTNLLPELARHAPGAEFFYEIKSNVTKAEVKALRDAGVRHIQPGIESLSDRVLQLMRKGVSAIQNVQLLKWCMEYGVRVDWNILWGFPGEVPADYEAMVRLVPLLVHLEPPSRGSRIRLDRHSPNYKQAEQFGFRRVRPFPSYYRVYDDLPKEAVANLAYFFQADHDLDGTIDQYTADLKTAIESWHRTHGASKLFYVEDDGAVAVLDSRPHLAQRQNHMFRGLASAILRLCDAGQSEAQLARLLPDVSPDRIKAEVEPLCDLGILWTDGRKYLSLAVSLQTYLQSRRNARLETGMDSLLAPA